MASDDRVNDSFIAQSVIGLTAGPPPRTYSASVRRPSTPYSVTYMAGRSKTAPLAATPPTVGVQDGAEHIYIESEDHGANPAASARTVRHTVTLRNPLRGTGAELALYAEGFLKVTKLRRGNADKPFFLDLRFVDPVPTLERVIAARWLAAALGCTALAALAAFLLRFDALYGIAAAALAIATVSAAATLYAGLHLSHERTEFCTLHGRSAVLELIANFGSVKKHRAFVPLLSQAIEEAAERIGTDTAAFLRAEMREHYRLRGDGVLHNDECSRGTGRILAQFDVQL